MGLVMRETGLHAWAFSPRDAFCHARNKQEGPHQTHPLNLRLFSLQIMKVRFIFSYKLSSLEYSVTTAELQGHSSHNHGQKFFFYNTQSVSLLSCFVITSFSQSWIPLLLVTYAIISKAYVGNL